jgi:hypothetical protein
MVHSCHARWEKTDSIVVPLLSYGDSGLGNINYFVGEGQQKFTRPDQTRERRSIEARKEWKNGIRELL